MLISLRRRGIIRFILDVFSSLLFAPTDLSSCCFRGKEELVWNALGISAARLEGDQLAFSPQNHKLWLVIYIYTPRLRYL